MISYLANPERFSRLAKPIRPYIAALSALLFMLGLYLSFSSPPDYQQGQSVRIMYVHVPAAMLGESLYLAMGIASFFGLIYKHALADAAAKAMAPVGAVFTGLSLVTGSLWGKPMWGTWWQWDGRMTSVLVLFLLYISYMAIHAAIEDEQRAAKSAAILAMVGLVNLPIIKFSVEWWNSLHQGSTLFAKGGPSLAPSMLYALLVMMAAYYMLAFWLVLVRLDTQIISHKIKARLSRQLAAAAQSEDQHVA